MPQRTTLQGQFAGLQQPLCCHYRMQLSFSCCKSSSFRSYSQSRGKNFVLRACTKAKVKRVVVVSSVAAVLWNPNWPKGKVVDESCWSDKEFCKTIEITK